MNNLKPKIEQVAHLQIAENLATENEALSLKPYHDTVSKLTIGYGRNIEDRGISYAEAELMLANDLHEADSYCKKQFPWYKDLSDVRKAVIMDLYHNMGMPSLLAFKNMLRAISEQNWTVAAKELKDSRYYRQVGVRAQRNYLMLKFNKLYSRDEAREAFSKKN